MRSSKEDKEAFVSGHEGTTPIEVLLVSASAPIGLACHAVILTTTKSKWIWKSDGGTAGKVKTFLLEALVVWFPMILCQTNFLYPFGVGLLFCQCLIIMAVFATNGTIQPSTSSTTTTSNISISTSTPRLRQRLDFLTMYRSSIMYLTFIAILAVDFPLFPRRFCKTETLGYGLMDIGAACFCFSGGLVSPKARRRQHIQQQQHHIQQHKQQQHQQHQFSQVLYWFKPLWSALPLIMIGIIRIIANNELEYQEHTSEYGIHWNYFLTMGVVAILPPILPTATTTTKLGWVLPIIVLLTIYQLALSTTSTFNQTLQEYIEMAPRHCTTGTSNFCHFFAANREGILGCIGYLSLHLAGEYIGHYYIWNTTTTITTQQATISSSSSTRNTTTTSTTTATCRELFQLATYLWILLFVLTYGLGLPVSRRSTNAPFCIWAMAHNVLLLAILRYLFPPFNTTTTSSSTNTTTSTMVPRIMDTVNRHGLIMFLIANLLTGLVNLTIPTLEIGDEMALGIVFVYICLVGLAALLVDTILVYVTTTTQQHEQQQQQHTTATTNATTTSEKVPVKAWKLNTSKEE